MDRLLIVLGRIEIETAIKLIKHMQSINRTR